VQQIGRAYGEAEAAEAPQEAPSHDEVQDVGVVSMADVPVVSAEILREGILLIRLQL